MPVPVSSAPRFCGAPLGAFGEGSMSRTVIHLALSDLDKPLSPKLAHDLGDRLPRESNHIRQLPVGQAYMEPSTRLAPVLFAKSSGQSWSGCPTPLRVRPLGMLLKESEEGALELHGFLDVRRVSASFDHFFPVAPPVPGVRLEHGPSLGDHRLRRVSLLPRPPRHHPQLSEIAEIQE